VLATDELRNPGRETAQNHSVSVHDMPLMIEFFLFWRICLHPVMTL